MSITAFNNNGYSYSSNNYSSLTNFPSSIAPKSVPVDVYEANYNSNANSFNHPDTSNANAVINSIGNPNSSMNSSADYISNSYSPYQAYAKANSFLEESANVNSQVANSQDTNNGYMASYQNYQNQAVASTITNHSSYADPNSSNYDAALQVAKPSQPLPTLSNGPYFNVDPYSFVVSTYSDPTSSSYDSSLTNTNNPASPLFNQS